MEHTRSAHDHHGIIFLVFYSLLAAEVVDVLILEGIPRFLVESLLDLLAQHVDVCLVDLLAFVDQFDGVVYPDVLEFLDILVPKLIQDEQQLLSASSRKDGQ